MTPPPVIRARTASLHWLLAILVAVLAGPAAAATALPSMRLERALAVAADTEFFPESSPARQVALPDDWSASSPGEVSAMWYRVTFDAEGVRANGELLGLYVERACSSVAVLLNGKLIHVSGRLMEPVSRNCQRPQLIAVPGALLEARGNQLDLKVVGFPLHRVASHQRAGGLSAIELGPHVALMTKHRWRTAFAINLPQVITGSLVLVGSLIFAMGWANRPQSFLAYYGALLIGWALVLSRQWVSDMPWPNASSEFLLAILATFVTFAAVQFLMRYAGERRRWIDLGLPVQCAVMPLSLMVAGAQNLHAMATFWYVVLAVQIGAASAFYLRKVWPDRRRQFWLMLGLGCAMGLAAALEFGAQQVGIDQRIVDAAQLLPPLLFMGLGLRMVQQYGRALSDAQNDRVELERRVQEAAAQIERNFAQLADMKVEQVTERERKRIAADLHDDLGAKLLTIVHTSDNERISTLAREALEEMRLSVRGLTGKPVPLLNALGDWRAEVMSRLSQAGVDGHWHSPTEEDVPQMLSARAYVQTTRILREAVSNIIKHSGASRCTVRCTIADGDFQLIVQDNGKGIPMELDGRLDRGHGMATMKHRAKQLQGQCLVESGPGYGTVIRLTLPVDRNVAPA
ncbi:MAG: sensor histidine kinase [Burkholderiaceae bacterium]|nr:sensor histidine kinase [Burkholderiaceae bacterium]